MVLSHTIRQREFSSNKNIGIMSKTCKECGCQMEDNARFCPQCGCPVKDVKESAPMEPEKVENENEDKKSPSDETSFKLTIVLIAIGIIVTLIVIVCTSGSRTNQNVQDFDSVASDTAVAEEPYIAESTDSDTVAPSDSPISSSSSSTHNGSQYAFDFEVSGTPYHLSFNKEEKTARLEVNGKTFYGTCEYDGLYHEGQIFVGGFDGADDYDIHKGGERCYWSNGAWIDYKNNYLYITQNAAKAYNPDYRIKLTPAN